MPKRNRKVTHEKILRRIEEGYGQGSGKAYRPWNTIHNKITGGLSTREMNAVTDRVHHMLMRLEWYFFQYINWNQNVVDIQEHFALLPTSETQKIASDVLMKHPTVSDKQGQRHPEVLTTTFLVTFCTDGGTHKVAYDVYYSETLNHMIHQIRTAIAYIYWKNRHIPYETVTDEQISQSFAMNVDFVQRYTDISSRVSLTVDDIASIAQALTQRALVKEDKLMHIARKCDTQFGLNPGASITVAYHLIANHYWIIDMNVRRIYDSIIELQ